MGIRELPYEGTIEQREGKLRYRRAGRRDAAAIAELYRSIAVTEKNMKEKFDPGSEHSFARTGGMFEIIDRQRLECELEAPDSFFAVFEESEGEPLACFWFSEKNPELEFLADRKGETVYPREVIVSPKARGRHLGKLIYYTIFEAMEQNGYRESICDVYQALGYQDADGWHETNMLNEPSYGNLLALGARPVTQLWPRKVRAGTRTVLVRSWVVRCIHAEVLSGCGAFLKKNGIYLSDHGRGGYAPGAGEEACNA